MCNFMCGANKEACKRSISQALMPQVGKSALMFVACHGHTETAVLLIERGADIEAKDNVRNKPLLMMLLCYLVCCHVFRFDIFYSSLSLLFFALPFYLSTLNLISPPLSLLPLSVRRYDDNLYNLYF